MDRFETLGEETLLFELAEFTFTRTYYQVYTIGKTEYM